MGLDRHVQHFFTETTDLTSISLDISSLNKSMMGFMSPSSLILLTYKGKVLLMHKTNGVLDEIKHPWCLIGGIKDKEESFEEAMARTVKKEAGIRIANVQCVSVSCYHAQLTDDNVNKIERSENQLLDFFTMKEVAQLYLSDSTQDFLDKHGDLIQIL